MKIAELDIYKISPNPSLPSPLRIRLSAEKRGIIPPFGKGRAGGILHFAILTIWKQLML
jgi:hypothetical protein